MSTAQAAIPHASAANSVAARPGTRPWGSPESTRPAGTATLAAVTRATGLVRSMLSSGASVTSLASTATQARSPPCPAGRISRSARPAPVTGPQVPSITRPPSPGAALSPGPSPTAAVSVPAASSLTRLSSAEVSAPSAAASIAAASTAPASTVGRNPPGTSARASSSAATASSGRPAP